MVRLKGNTVKISVRHLVEFLLRHGDLAPGTGAASPEAMNAGSRIHRKIQKRGGSNYRAEVTLKRTYLFGEYTLEIEGRADGIIDPPGDTAVIDEIKGTYANLALLEEPELLHSAQAKCYAYLYAAEQGRDRMRVQVTYCHLESEEIKRFQEEYSFSELERWFHELIETYRTWCDLVYRQRQERDRSAGGITFPYPYRPGQKEFAHAVYRTVHRGRILFAMAPTGVGKTLSTVYPAVKAMGDGKTDKIFYLTAKTIARTVAEESVELLRGKGLSLCSVTLTAKEKLCIAERQECMPEMCERARGHYDRVNEALFDLISHEKHITRQTIEAYAERYQVCPYELNLDASSFADLIVCDYNYVFDPNVCLKRYFGEGGTGDYVFLVDEAHNLVERAREMYSAVLYEGTFQDIRRRMKGKSRKVSAQLTRCVKQIEEIRCRHDFPPEGRSRGASGYERHTNLDTLLAALAGLADKTREFLEEEPEWEDKTRLWDFYFSIWHFLNMSERVDENYEIYSEYTETGDFKIRLFCINPERNLAQCLEKGRSTIFFSATLLPLSYYRKLLSNDPEHYAIYIPSPFDQKNRLLLIGNDVSSRYTRRTQAEYGRIMEYIDALADGKKGNYFVYFPSYQMLQDVYDVCVERGMDIKCRLLVQTPSMTEQEKELFLQEFDRPHRRTMLAFAVMGGIFSEGIDLKGCRLTGAAIVGTGIPMICSEREILREHFDREGVDGFDYAYRFPGMNRVLQAAGRVIRTDMDRGVILLLDDRFMQAAYRNLFPAEWADHQAGNAETARRQIQAFWERDPGQEEIRNRLFRLQDSGYRAFHSKLMPTVDPERIIGVRMPDLRRLAGELAKTPGAEEFLDALPHHYYEENNLHGILIGMIREYEKCVREVNRFLPCVDNWATCDMMSPKIFQKHREELMEEIERWLHSPHPYTVRFGIRMLMDHYLDEQFHPEYPELVANVRSEEYYVNMMVAWYFATALAKQYDAVVRYLEEQRLALWTHNKAIQKAVESRRLTERQKQYLRTLKRKNKK